ncbi:putative NUDIX hydrolase [Aedoeadaptatus ivorii]|uniref:Putative NUDIX hydrolase n=1 Tax=Aedoeadaptatus ivorii TaxID=54006 RepID=A0A448V071_9FIRM|nr:CoA pyrophosphatase [Peptoniphilus ivorii]VEJ34811.1 putative NUDIX hydrolase [Peptoniphilus ivorii]
MDKEKIQDILNHHEPGPLDLDHRFAVLVALAEVDGEAHVIFEKRSILLKNHTGEVSLPGGKIEAGETPKEAAIRETVEELRIREEQIEILGEADYLVLRTGKAVHCFIGILHDVVIDEIEPEPMEVAYVFSVPLKIFLEQEPEAHIIEFKKDKDEGFPYELIPKTTVAPFRNVQDRIYFYKEAREKEQIVWGMTAKIMYGVARLLRKGL